MSVQTLSEWYLTESGGNPQLFLENLEMGQRLGQALFNSLSMKDQEKLRGTLFDPFYKTKTEDLHTALDFLTK